MPTYNQCYFLKRAVISLMRQTFVNWELIIINDGSTDETVGMIESLPPDPRVVYLCNERNMGLGCSVNRGLDRARYGHIAYLPSDDYYDPEHLGSMARGFEEHPGAVLVFSGIRYAVNDTMSYSAGTESATLMPGCGLNMVQVAHKKTADRWVGREVWESPDLNITFWNRLLDKGSFIPTRKVSCFMTRHPHQRSRLIAEGNSGGINVFRRYYKVREPLKIRAHEYKFVDEEKNYARFRDVRARNPQGLKILIVGELSYNPERIVALEEAGRRLFGLWVNNDISGFNTVGPLPFGNVEDIGYDDWRNKVRRLKPDIIYATLNFRSVTLAWEVLRENPDIPFVWHFKEGPTISLQVGTWEKLMYIYNNADGLIHISGLVKEWVELFACPRGISMIMDGDLPKKDYFEGPFTAKLSETDGEVHTVVAGRMIGWSVADMKRLADSGIHLHHYSGDGKMEGTNERFMAAVPGYFHAHPHCGIGDWIGEFSKYDAGWLHKFESRNNGDLLKASWDDLNVPARISTYAAAGLPVILKANKGHLVSTNRIVDGFGIGIQYDTIGELIPQLKDRRLVEARRANMLRCRGHFTFDHHVPALESFFREVIRKNNRE